jgi:hypothetical protein
MFKQLFRGKDPENPGVPYSNGQAGQSVSTALVEPLPRRLWDRGVGEESEPAGSGSEPVTASANGVDTRMAPNHLAAFDEIYRSAPATPPKAAYDIRKVAEMLNSDHLTGMSIEAKRSSVLMALEAVGVQVDDILHDAMARLCALNAYEEAQNRELKEFETAKTRENSLIQAELDRLSSAHMVRIQANLDQVARKEDQLRRWAQLKQQESEQIASTAAFCAPPGSSVSSMGNLTAAVSRYGAEAAAGKR